MFFQWTKQYNLLSNEQKSHSIYLQVISGQIIRLYQERRQQSDCLPLDMGPYLLVQHHVHSVWSDVPGELAQEGEDVLDGGGVGQPSESQAVSHPSRRGRRETVGSMDTKGAGATEMRGAEEYRFNTFRPTQTKDTVTHCSANTPKSPYKQRYNYALLG